MSLKRRVEFKILRLKQAFRSIQMPGWLISTPVRLGLVGIIAVVGVAYVLQTTSSSASGYELHELEKKNSALESENQKMQIEIADYSSLKNIQSRLAKMNMVRVSKINYIGDNSAAVARR